MAKIICNECGKVFNSEDELAYFAETEQGVVYPVDFFSVFPKEGDEVFKGCPTCMTDGCLMDVED